MRVFLNDFGGYPFPAQLSHALAQRGHEVQHAFCNSLAGTPPGTYSDSSGKAAAVLKPISLRQLQQKSSLLKRRSQDIEYGKLAVKEIRSFRPDVVISANTPLNAQQIIQRHCQQQGIPFIYWLQDLISVAIEAILSRRYSFVGRGVGKLYQRLEQKLLLDSQRVVTISGDFLPRLSQWGVDPGKVSVIENWAPLDQFPQFDRDNDWAAENKITDRFVFMYSGTLSLKHNPQLLVHLAQSMRDKECVVLVRTQGEAADWLRVQADQQGLKNLVVQPFGPVQQTAQAFASADVLLALLEPEASSFSVPSKVLAYLCAGRPVLLAVPEQNLAAKIVTGNAAGLAVDPKSPDRFVDAAARLLQDTSLRQSMGNNARNYAEKHFNIETICDRFDGEIRAAMNAMSIRGKQTA